MTPEDLAFTNKWWEALLDDDERMVRWLQKLHGTEFAGYQDNRDAAAKWTTPGSVEERIFLATGDDEMKHADLLVPVLKGRGAWPIEVKPAPSEYWDTMEQGITSLETCAAVFHLGEKLAYERFSVLYNHERTPDDILYFLTTAMPEERHHARVFYKMAQNSALIRMEERHNAAVQMLKSGRAP